MAKTLAMPAIPARSVNTAMKAAVSAAFVALHVVAGMSPSNAHSESTVLRASEKLNPVIRFRRIEPVEWIVYSNPHRYLNLAGTLPLIPMQRLSWKADTSVRVFLSYYELTKQRRTLQELNERIQDFSADSLLLFASKLGVSLIQDDGLHSAAYQRQIAKDLLPAHLASRYLRIEEVIFWNNRSKKKNTGEPLLLLTPIMVMNFIKRVLIHHKDHGVRQVDTTVDASSASDAFMLILAYAAYMGGEAEHRRNWSTEDVFGEMIRNSLMLHRELAERLVSRYYAICFTLPESGTCEEKKLDKSFGSIFFDSTGVDLKIFMTVGYLLISHFRQARILTADKEEKFPKASVLHWEGFFSDPAFDEKELSRILDLCRFPKGQNGNWEWHVKEAEKPQDENADAFEYSVQPLLERPLLEFPGGYYAPSSFQFLSEKFSHSIYWTMFDYLKAQNGGKRPGKFEDYWGCLCQKYIESLFTSDLIDSHLILIYFDPPYAKAHKGGTSEAFGSDIILFDKRTQELFLFEITYSSLRIETLNLKKNTDAVSSGFDKLVGKSGQIHTIINDIKGGALKLQGLEPTDIKSYRPYIITMAYFPVWPFLLNTLGTVWRGFYDRLKDKGYLQEADVRRLGIMNVAEVEDLCARHKGGTSIFKMLRGWERNERWRNESLHNYLVASHSGRANYATLMRQKTDSINALFKYCGISVEK